MVPPFLSRPFLVSTNALSALIPCCEDPRVRTFAGTAGSTDRRTEEQTRGQTGRGTDSQTRGVTYSRTDTQG